MPQPEPALREDVSPRPEKYFLDSLGVVPIFPDAPTPKHDFHEYPIERFWEAQSKFEFALRLQSALTAQSNPVDKIKAMLAEIGINWEIKGPNAERQYIWRAQGMVADLINPQLVAMSPRIARAPRMGLSGVWACYTLLQAMYLMLFLDIAGWAARIAECEKCHSLFYADRNKVRYCSPNCENRARSLRAYYRKKGDS